MDQLGLTAADLLNEAPDLTGPVRSAVLVQGGSISLFMRATLHSTEALCCDCSLEIDVLALGIAAEQVLITLGAAA